MDRHEIVCELKRLRSEYGRAPKRSEARSVPGLESSCEREFGTFGMALSAAGMGKEKEDEIRSKEFKYLRPLADPNVLKKTHTYDLKALFEKHGNPESLKLLAMPDLHIEHADPWAMNCFLEVASWYQPHVMLFMGDLLNAGGLSHWPAEDLAPKRVVPEIKKGREFLITVRRLLAKEATVLYLEGNHEDWINQFMRSGENAQFFDGLEELGLEINLKKLLNLEAMGIELFPLNQILRIGKAGFTHGLYVGDNHAKKHLLTVKSNIFYGHCHDDKSFSDASMDGTIEAQSLGCLCDLNPKFLRGRLNNWSHNFGMFEFLPDGRYTKIVPRIQEGVVSLFGKVFRA